MKMKMMTVSWPSSQQDQLQGSWSDQSLLPLSSHKQTCSSKVGNRFCDLETGISGQNFLNFWSKCFEFPEPEVQFPAQIQVANFFFGCFLYLSDKFLIFQMFCVRSSKHVPPDYDDACHPLRHHFCHEGHLSGAPLIEEATEDMLMIWPAVSKYFNFDLIWGDVDDDMTSIRDKRRNRLAHPEHASHLVLRLMEQL